jgi:hypothetical protein
MATTSCTIQERGMKMAEEFIWWLFEEAIPEALVIIGDAVWNVLCLLIKTATLPLWIIPFAFWYFRVYKPQQEEPEIPDTWKQQTMSRFERVE